MKQPKKLPPPPPISSVKRLGNSIGGTRVWEHHCRGKTSKIGRYFVVFPEIDDPSYANLNAFLKSCAARFIQRQKMRQSAPPFISCVIALSPTKKDPNCLTVLATTEERNEKSRKKTKTFSAIYERISGLFCSRRG